MAESFLVVATKACEVLIDMASACTITDEDALKLKTSMGEGLPMLIGPNGVFESVARYNRTTVHTALSELCSQNGYTLPSLAEDMSGSDCTAEAKLGLLEKSSVLANAFVRGKPWRVLYEAFLLAFYVEGISYV